MSAAAVLTLIPSAYNANNFLQNRAKRPSKYLDTYSVFTFAYSPDDSQHPALASHEDIFKLILLIRTKSKITREEITELAFPHQALKVAPKANDQHTAVNLALRVMAMISYAASSQGWNLLEVGLCKLP